MIAVQQEFVYGTGHTYVKDLVFFDNLSAVKPIESVYGSTGAKSIIYDVLKDEKDSAIEQLIADMQWSKKSKSSIRIPTIKYSEVISGKGLTMSVAYWNGVDHSWMSARDLVKYLKEILK